jgi:hypothetical protein
LSYATYGPRTPVHATRHGPTKTTKNLWIVLHTSEGGESTGSAEALSIFMTQPATKSNVASYNDVFDTDRVIPAVPYNVVPYAAGGGNAQGIHGCFPGRANQTREQWLDSISRPMIKQAAAWIVDVSIEFKIPLRHITWQQVKAYESGICDHFAITGAFKKTTHTDVGPGFPWDVLFADIDALIVKPTTPPTQPYPPGTEFLDVGDITMTDEVRIYDSRRDDDKQPANMFAIQTHVDANTHSAVFCNVTTIAGSEGGFMGVGGETSFNNFQPNQVVDNARPFKLNGDGTISLGTSGPRVHVLVDLIGVYKK